MAEDPSNQEPDDRLNEILLEFLELSERGVEPGSAEILARHPEFAPELKDFLETWARVQTLTGPVRSASQAGFETGRPKPGPSAGVRRADRTPSNATGVGDASQETVPPAVKGEQEFGGWLGRWLRDHPPISLQQFPFLHREQHATEIGRLGPYRLLAVAGSGGMGVVFRGEDISLHRPVAVKVLRPELAADPIARERFLREARSAAALDHEHVVAVYHVGEENGIPYLGMQWLRGLSLEELLRRAGWLELPAILRLGRQIALGLAAAHERGLLHRDIKPANLWVEQPSSASGSAEPGTPGRIKILDFGLARAAGDETSLTHIGAMVGTPAYMSPEQAAGQSVDVRSDLFGLGVVLYRLCTGRLPFSRPHATSSGGSAAPETPRPVKQINPAIPDELADLVMELLHRDPAKRPSSASEVAQRLETLEHRQPAPDRIAQPVAASVVPERIVQPVNRQSRWRPVAVTIAASLVIIAVLFGGVLVRFATDRGEVVIAVDDPETEVTVKEGGAVIHDKKGQRSITLSAGEHELEVSVKDANGEIRFPFKKAFVLTRGGRQVIDIREELAGTGARAASPASESMLARPTGAGQRGVAERVLSLGGSVRISTASGEQLVRAKGDLPKDDFRIVGLDLGHSAVTDSGLSLLRELTDLRELDLVDTRITDVGLEEIGKLKSLQRLVLSGTAITSNGLSRLRDLRGLVVLGLDSTRVDDAGLAHTSGFINLERLNLNNTAVGDDGLAHIAPLTKLKFLLIADPKVTDAGLIHLRRLTELRELTLRNAALTDNGVANLEGLTALRALDLNNTRVGDAGLDRLSTLQDLHSLNLVNTRITDSGLSRLRKLTKLQRLLLSGTRITDAGMPELKVITSLQTLDFNQTNIGDAGLMKLCEMKNLRSLGLIGTRVTDAGLAHLAGLKDLQGLGVADTRVTDAGMIHIAGLSRLEYLNLAHTRLTDAGMANLDGLTALYFLHLSGTGITDAGVVHLSGMKHLVHVYLDGTRVTDAGLAAFLIVPFPPLTGLDLRGSRVSPAGVAAVKGLLPRVKVDWWEPNHRAAEAVLAAGGSVHVRCQAKAGDIVVKTAAALPGDYFRLTRAVLTDIPQPREALKQLVTLSDPEFDDLQEVDLSGSGLTDSDLEILSPNPCRRLILDRIPLYGPGLAHLKKMPRLTELHLACPTLSFLGLGYLGDLKHLQRLSLAGSGATDASLKHLVGLTSLRALDLTHTKVSPSGLATLKKSLPECQITSDTAGQ
jgi:serine/threonine protein kinase/Leucine-rich repeat (LRR) protein